ncbi:helix-turn-helix domain-containing protein [Natranaerobius thermophilus]|uniref:DNA binding domain protein, excisionase family n=1 Tax=Natranaerobius thermophilus (strain ATCC BAA-1301 / DSM 18059 / JW/NM-WN-LF) TaxID=457570 RepID=B2A8P0_NATTJ|nr:helix-turn-helix domain-containing protein [Natranaerobius thermophilus]ACB86489.1 DNA binding domain protein, excisionase family [Natranaerobius thermophilus JW/NM-WN-LF]
MNEKMLTVEEVAEQAGVHVESVRRWIRSGRLPASLPSRYHGYQVKEKDLQDFLQKKNKVQQKGQIEAEQVLRSLADAYNKYQQDEYLRIAYGVAELSGLLPDFQKRWSSGQSDFEIDRLLEQRETVLRNLEKNLGEKTRAKEEKTLKKIEGKLILKHYS